MSRIATSPSLSFLLFVLSLSLPALVAAQQIYRDSNIFAYQGCITETTDIANSSNPRALSGSSLVDEEAMTVPMCLEFCSSGGESGERPYRYAGLQYSRECWCGQLVSDLSQTVPDSQCNLTCAGDDNLFCGGTMRISLYMAESGSAATAVAFAPLLAALGGAVAISLHL